MKRIAAVAGAVMLMSSTSASAMPDAFWLFGFRMPAHRIAERIGKVDHSPYQIQAVGPGPSGDQKAVILATDDRSAYRRTRYEPDMNHPVCNSSLGSACIGGTGRSVVEVP